jgi:hypothetical protein
MVTMQFYCRKSIRKNKPRSTQNSNKKIEIRLPGAARCKGSKRKSSILEILRKVAGVTERTGRPGRPPGENQSRTQVSAQAIPEG